LPRPCLGTGCFKQILIAIADYINGCLSIGIGFKDKVFYAMLVSDVDIGDSLRICAEHEGRLSLPIFTWQLPHERDIRVVRIDRDLQLVSVAKLIDAKTAIPEQDR
jgi:hypothetical protein